MVSEDSLILNLPTGYRVNTVSKENPKPFHHSDLEKNLEGIVFKEGTGKEKTTLENILSDKSKTLKATVKALLEEIKLRETLDSHLLKKIDEEICQQHTQIMQLGNQKVSYQSEIFMEIKNMKMKIEDNVLELEKERRSEYLECWRDLMFLKIFLMVAL